MRNFLIIIFIISPLYIFGQQYIDVILKDSTSYRGDVIEYNMEEFKLIHKRKLVTIPQSDIILPKQIPINHKKFITTIKTNDENWYQGKVVIENDTSVMLHIGKDLDITIAKSNIALRKNRARKDRFFIQTTIHTKDGNKFVGEVIDKNENFVMIDLEGRANIQQINNQNIKSEIVVYKKTGRTLRRVLIGIGILYILLLSA